MTRLKWEETPAMKEKQEWLREWVQWGDAHRAWLDGEGQDPGPPPVLGAMAKPHSMPKQIDFRRCKESRGYEWSPLSAASEKSTRPNGWAFSDSLGWDVFIVGVGRQTYDRTEAAEALIALLSDKQLQAAWAFRNFCADVGISLPEKVYVFSQSHTQSVTPEQVRR